MCSLNAGQTWSDSQERWIGGNDGVRGPAYYGCKQYATAQANFFGAKPRMLSFSFIDTMVGFSLRRGVLGTTDGRWYPYASRRAHSFNGGFGGHPIGWGRSLFDCASRRVASPRATSDCMTPYFVTSHVLHLARFSFSRTRTPALVLSRRL